MHKSPITLLVFATICGSLQAGEMSVSGSGTAEYASFSRGHKPGASSAWDMGDSLTFAGSGVMDSGVSVALSYATMDNDNTTADEKTTFQIRYSGGFWGASTMGADDPTSLGIDNPTPDDMTPTAYEEACGWNVRVSHSQYNTGLPDENKVQAGVTCGPAAMPGLSAGLSASYADEFFDSGDTQAVAAGVRYGFYTGIPGMTVGISATVGHVGTDHGSTNDVVNQDSWKYTTAGAAIAYAVSDNLSISYGVAHNGSSIDSAKDDESMGISAAYTSGGMTIAANTSNMTYNDGVQESGDRTYKISLSFTF